MAVVVAVCSIAGLKQSRTKAQMKATLCACLVLALVVVAFCEVVIVSSQSWAAILFACIAAVAPLVAYCTAMVVWSTSGLSAQSDVREPLFRVGIEEREPVARFVPVASVSSSYAVRPVSLAAASEADPVSSPAQTPTHTVPAGRDLEGLREPTPEPKSQPKSQLELQPKPQPELAPKSEPNPQPKLTVAVALPPARKADPVAVSPCEPASESTHNAAPDRSSESDTQPVTFNASSYFERAQALRDKGMYVVAARLCAQCAELSDDRATFRKAALEEIACYVHADRLDHAKRLAESLLACADDLTPLERIKLKAVVEAA